MGPDQHLEIVNIQFQIFDKPGAPLTQPVFTNQLWAGFGSQCEDDLFADPVVLYDRAVDRWLVSYIAMSLSQGWAVCTSVSATDDPAGAYFLYELKPPQVPDYPKLGTWPGPVHNAYVMGTTALTDPQGKHAAPRWFELRRFPGGSWQIAYQGTFAPTGSNRWTASVALDGSGSLAMGYIVVDADLRIYPALAYTARPVNEPAFVGERWLAVGSGFQTGSLAGDDPSGDGIASMWRPCRRRASEVSSSRHRRRPRSPSRPTSSSSPFPMRAPSWRFKRSAVWRTAS